MPKKETTLVGTITLTTKGVGYFESEDAPEKRDKTTDIEIQPDKVGTSLPGDKVKIKIIKVPGAERVQGEVVAVLERARTTFVGTLELAEHFGFVIPDDRKIPMDFFVPSGALLHAKTGDKVQVELVKWDDAKKNPEGKIVKVFGSKGDNNAEMVSIVYEKGFETDFPHKVIAEAEHLEKTEKPIAESEIKKRRDFRQTLTFTIDPFDAKDFDDAISFKDLGGGKYEIGVHIADVSHYVREKSELDREAVKRGFSVYLVDRTIPMLPEVLSNDICSLKPNEDRLTFSAVFVIDDNATVHDSWYGKTIIHSAKRFTYEEAQEILEKGGLYEKELTTLNKIAKIFQQQKWAKGAIDFEQDEIKFKLDATGKPIEVIRKVRKDAHKLVEEYMLLANRGVAEYLTKQYEEKHLKGAAMIYRIHDLPDPQKVRDLTIFLKALGYELESRDGKVTSKQIAKVVRAVEGKPEEALIKTAAIRSMAKAIYSTRNVGHFGLAYDFYTHFTSPIRRYADLLVHRLLYRFLMGEPVEQGEIAKYERMASAATEREIQAAEAERASIKYKQVEYMQDKIGQIFDGTITGVTGWGIYVEEVNTKCEGMVRIKDIGDDFYALDEKTYTLRGQRTGKKYTLGDKVRFKISRADLDSKTMDFNFV